jgi:hypothetical protein
MPIEAVATDCWPPLFLTGVYSRQVDDMLL